MSIVPATSATPVTLDIPLTQAVIRRLIPHAGTMCLLDQVLRWDDTEIDCLAVSHCSLGNPLRHNGMLPIHAGIEYCAQAIALHGGLTSKDQGPPRRGFLVVIINTQWTVPRLDDCKAALQVTASRQVRLKQGASYRFALQHEGHTLLTGQAVVALD